MAKQGNKMSDRSRAAVAAAPTKNSNRTPNVVGIGYRHPKSELAAPWSNIPGGLLPEEAKKAETKKAKGKKKD